MKKHLFAAALLCSFSCLSAAPVFAQSVQLGKRLQKVEPYMAPLKVDILDETPRVTDRRAADTSPIYQIMVGPGPKATRPVVIMSTPALQADQPGMIVLDPHHPPAARFESNIPAAGPLAPGGLPDGTTSKALARGKLMPLRPAAIPGAAAPAHAASIQPATAPVLTYPAVASGDGSSIQKTNSLLRGRLLHPNTAQQK